MRGYGGKIFGGKTGFSKRKNALLTGSVFSAAIFTAFAFLFLFFPFIVRGNGRFSNEFYAERTAQAAGIETREYFPAGVCVCGVDVGGKEKRPDSLPVCRYGGGDGNRFPVRNRI